MEKTKMQRTQAIYVGRGDKKGNHRGGQTVTLPMGGKGAKEEKKRNQICD